MRFLGAWVASLVAIVLAAGLVLGRDDPRQTDEVAEIAAAFDERYATATVDLETGGVLYLRSEYRPVPDGGVTSIRGTETWVAMDGAQPVARSEESNSDGEVVRILEFEGATQTLLVDRTAGIENREPVAVPPVQTPNALLIELRSRMLDAALRAGQLVGSSVIASPGAARLAGPDLTSSHSAVGARGSSGLRLLQWAVLPAGTPLGTPPD